MLAAERRDQILAAARRDGVVRVADLVTDLGCSQVTIRRDLDALSDRGLLVKVHGGAVLPGSALSRPSTDGPETRNGRTLGIMIPAATYFRHIVDGVRGVAEQRGCAIRLVTSGYDRGAEPRLVNELIGAGASGLLLAPSLDRAERRAGFGPAELDYLDDLTVPAVLIEREPGPTGSRWVSSVRSAHERGVSAACGHLYGLGHRRIALISRVFSQTGFFVERGFRQSVTDLGLDPDTPVITGLDPDTVRPGLSPEGPQVIFEALRSAGVTAVLCHGDEDALVLSQYAQTRGLSVPGDLSIVSYNDEVAALGNPPITAVAPPREEIGAYATELLLSMLDSSKINSSKINSSEINSDSDDLVERSPVQVRMDPRLVIRQSTAAPRA